MSKVPVPPDPAWLAAHVAPAWMDLPAGTPCFRVYFRTSPHPAVWNQFRFYGPTQARFDHHEPPPAVQTRGILYAATLPAAALAEVFQARRTINTRRHEPWLVGFALRRSIRLLDLTGLWPTRAGASVALATGPRPRVRPWARAIYAAYPDAEGIWYGSSMHANTPCVALFERAQTAVADHPGYHRALADTLLRAYVQNAADHLGYRLIL